MTTAQTVFDTSNGAVTQRYYDQLLQRGMRGVVALNLLRALKASKRAKVYSPQWRKIAYEKKKWSMSILANTLTQHAADLGVVWGWGRDKYARGYTHVLYVDLPTGQASFHSPERFKGPDYVGEWSREPAIRSVLRFCDAVMRGAYDLRDEGVHYDRLAALYGAV